MLTLSPRTSRQCCRSTGLPVLRTRSLSPPSETSKSFRRWGQAAEQSANGSRKKLFFSLEKQFKKLQQQKQYCTAENKQQQKQWVAVVWVRWAPHRFSGWYVGPGLSLWCFGLLF
jgi:hypothetical protein